MNYKMVLLCLVAVLFLQPGSAQKGYARVADDYYVEVHSEVPDLCIGSVEGLQGWDLATPACYGQSAYGNYDVHDDCLRVGITGWGACDVALYVDEYLWQQVSLAPHETSYCFDISGLPGANFIIVLKEYSY